MPIYRPIYLTGHLDLMGPQFAEHLATREDAPYQFDELKEHLLDELDETLEEINEHLAGLGDREGTLADELSMEITLNHGDASFVLSVSAGNVLEEDVPKTYIQLMTVVQQIVQHAMGHLRDPFGDLERRVLCDKLAEHIGQEEADRLYERGDTVAALNTILSEFQPMARGVRLSVILL